jgi:mono/diheme cytochrome c family protein
MAKHARFVVAVVLIVALLGGAKRRAVGTGPNVPSLNLQRSFAISDKAILAGFTFDRVLSQLVARSGVSGMTAESLYRQRWDTQNPGPGRDASMPHCDDELTNGKPSHNGFPRRCPTMEGVLVNEAYRPEDFFAIAITNRFDLADAAGTTCGQYRIVFAHRNEPPLQPLHIIFEGALANPNPAAGLASCRPVAQFWADLSAIDSMDERRVRLERFFFDGIPGFAPVVDPAHYRHAPAGIRTLQSRGDSQRFYQFRVVTERGRLFMKPDVLENLPFDRLFDASLAGERGERFRAEFLKHVSTLATRDVNLYHMAIPAEFLMVESDPDVGNDEPAFIYSIPFTRGLNSSAGLAFREAINAELRKSGSALPAAKVIMRAETQNCVGCHSIRGDVGEGVTFPPGLGDNQQVSEVQVAAGRFAISRAMEDVFIPHRMQILRDFLLTGKAPVHSN